MKQKILIGATLLLSAAVGKINMLNAMKVDYKTFPITKPYTPPLSVRYPESSRWTKALIAGSLAGGATYLSRHLTKFNRAFRSKIFSRGGSLLVGSVAGAFTYFYTKPTSLRFVDALLTSPIVALSHRQSFWQLHEKILTQKLDKIGALNATIEFFRTTNKELEKECPIIHIGECSWEDCGPCILSRHYQPHYRNIFENEVSQALIKKIKAVNSQQPINYTVFASGGAFDALVILAKTLAKCPNAKIDIHLIDLQYGTYAAVHTIFQGSIQAKNSQLLDFNAKWNHIVKVLRPHYSTISDQEIEKHIKLDCLRKELKLTEFLSILKSTFPCASLSLNLHGHKSRL